MGEVGITALRRKAAAVVVRAMAGEQVTVTDRGRPVALLTRPPAPEPGPDPSAGLAAQRDAERS